MSLPTYRYLVDAYFVALCHSSTAEGEGGGAVVLILFLRGKRNQKDANKERKVADATRENQITMEELSVPTLFWDFFFFLSPSFSRGD